MFRNIAHLIIIAGSIITTSVHAQDAKLDYPELQVTPLASERLKMEAQEEKNINLYSNLPLQISALTTLTAGIFQMGDVDLKKDVDKNSAKLAILVGGGWLAVNSYINMQYRPYTRALNKVSRLPKGTTREKLTLERMAEEEISSLGRLGNRIKWLSAATNFAASVYLISNSQKETKAKIFGGLSALMAMAPLLFENRWAVIDKEQQNYKKKIYGPIVTTGILEVPSSKAIVPAAFFYATF